MQMHEERVRAMRAMVRRDPAARGPAVLHVLATRVRAGASGPCARAETAHQPRLIPRLRTRPRDLPDAVPVATEPVQQARQRPGALPRGQAHVRLRQSIRDNAISPILSLLQPEIQQSDPVGGVRLDGDHGDVPGHNPRCLSDEVVAL